MISFAKLVATTLLVSSTVYAHESPSSHLRGSSEVEWDPYKHYKKVRDWLPEYLAHAYIIYCNKNIYSVILSSPTQAAEKHVYKKAKKALKKCDCSSKQQQ